MADAVEHDEYGRLAGAISSAHGSNETPSPQADCSRRTRRTANSRFRRRSSVAQLSGDYWSNVTCAPKPASSFVTANPIVDGRRLAVEWWANLQTNDGSSHFSVASSAALCRDRGMS